MKRMVGLICIVVLVLVSNVMVFANESQVKLGDVIINSTSGNEYLIDYGCSIDFYATDDKIIASGYTNTYTNVDSIYVDVYIEKYSSSSRAWETVYNDSKKLYDDDYVSLSIQASANPGTYRAFAIHKISENGTNETDTSHTLSIDIN
jgi:hypothetical protein